MLVDNFLGVDRVKNRDFIEVDVWFEFTSFQDVKVTLRAKLGFALLNLRITRRHQGAKTQRFKKDSNYGMLR